MDKVKFSELIGLSSEKDKTIGKAITHKSPNGSYGVGTIIGFEGINVIVKFETQSKNKSMRIEPNTIGFYAFGDVELKKHFEMLARNIGCGYIQDINFFQEIVEIKTKEELLDKLRPYIITEVILINMLINEKEEYIILDELPAYIEKDYFLHRKYGLGASVLNAIWNKNRNFFYNNIEYRIDVFYRTDMLCDFRPIVFGEGQIVWVYKKSINVTCAKNHSVKRAVAIVMTKDNKSVEIEIMRCLSCGSYFISEKSLEAQENLYDTLLMIKKPYEDYKNTISTLTNLGYGKNQSKLYECGYRAQITDTTFWRQQKIKDIIGNSLMTPQEVIRDLTMNLEDQRHHNNRELMDRWCEDLSFTQRTYRDYVETLGENRNVKFKYKN
jgi:hypothetical protein